MSTPAAIRELADFIGTLPNRAPEPSSEVLATNLIGLLPLQRGIFSRVGARGMTVGDSNRALHHYRMRILLGYVLLLLLTQWLVAAMNAPAQSKQYAAPAAIAAVAESSPPKSVQ